MRTFIFLVRNVFLSFIFIVILNNHAFAKSDTCYSVQVASIFDKEATYKNTTQYPSSCEVISFTNVKAIRCGCFETQKEARGELKKLRKKHRGAIIVRTYRSRFNKVSNNEDLLDADDLAEYEEQGEIPFKLRVQYYLYESELSVQGHMDLVSQAYIIRPYTKHKANLSASGQVEFGFKKDDFEAIAKVYAQGDYHDMRGSSYKNERSFIRIDEFYGKYDFEDDQVMAGKSIRFWGTLESKNITDGFNPDDLRSDVFDPQKMGSWNGSYTHYTDRGEVSFIVRLHEQDRRMPHSPYAYYIYSDTFEGVPLSYVKDLQTEKSAYRPSVFLKASGSTDSEYALDYTVVFENGYDSQRYYTDSGISNPLAISFTENAYIVNKLMTYDTLVVDSTLFKLEAVYADVADDTVVSDYYHLGLGIEHTLTQFNDEADLGLIAEYYKYDIFDTNKYDDIDLFEVYQNDLFLGARYSLNEGNDASIVAGAVFDLDYHEQVYYAEYEGRIADTFKLNLDYRYIKPSSDTSTVFNLLQRHQRISLKMGYYF